MNEAALTDKQREMLDRLTDPDRAAVLISFADNYSAGRRVACWFVHLIVGLGAIGGIVAGIYQGILILLKLRGGH